MIKKMVLGTVAAGALVLAAVPNANPVQATTNGHRHIGGVSYEATPVVLTVSDGDIRIGSATGDPDDGGQLSVVAPADPPIIRD